MQVPFVDLTREYESIASDVDSAIDDVLESGHFILGDHVEAFEEEFAEYLGVSHGVGLNSGSDALVLALKALGIGDGDEVITVSQSFVSTANAIVENGARPVFVDVDSETYCMDPNHVEEAITQDTAAIIPVHLYGHPVNMDPIVGVADKHDLAIVEDASQAHGASYRGQQVGTFGDISCFSLYPVKNLGAYGDAGIAATNNDELAREMRSLGDYGRTDKYTHERIQMHSRLDELQAAVLRTKLERLDQWNERRRAAASKYRNLLSDTSIETQAVHADAEHVYHLFVVQHPARDRLQTHLEQNGIETVIHYPVPIHRQPAYEGHQARYGLDVTEQVSSEVLSLPLHPWIREEEVENVARHVKSFEETA